MKPPFPAPLLADGGASAVEAERFPPPIFFKATKRENGVYVSRLIPESSVLLFRSEAKYTVLKTVEGIEYEGDVSIESLAEKLPGYILASRSCLVSGSKVSHFEKRSGYDRLTMHLVTGDVVQCSRLYGPQAIQNMQVVNLNSGRKK